MIALLPVVPLLLVILIIFLLRWIRRAPVSAWLVSILGVLISWILMIVFQPYWANQLIDLSILNSFYYSDGIRLQLDELSWTFGFIAISILISSLFVGTYGESRENQTSVQWYAISGAILYTALIFVSACSENLITILFWGGASLLVELGLQVGFQSPKKDVWRALPSTYGRMISFSAIFLAMILTERAGPGSGFHHFNQYITRLLIIACTVPAFIPIFTNQIAGWSGLPAVLKPQLFLSSYIPVLVVLNRTAEHGAIMTNPAFVLIFLCIIAFIAGFRWIGHVMDDDFNDWAAFIMVFCAASAISGQLQSCVTWSATFLLVGFYIQQRTIAAVWIRPLKWFVFFGLSCLPLSAAWAGTLLYSSAEPVWISFLAAQGLLLLCWDASINSKKRLEPWEITYAPLFNVISLNLIAGSWIGLSALNLIIRPELLRSLLQPANILPGLLVIGFWILFYLLMKFLKSPVDRAVRFFVSLFQLLRLLKRLERLIFWSVKPVVFLNRLLDSRAGLLWAILILALIFTFIGQHSGGK